MSNADNRTAIRTYDDVFLAEPPEGVLLHVGESRWVGAPAQVQLHGVVLGEERLLTQKQTE